MKCDKKTMLLYAVTDRAWTGGQTLYEQVESALKGGVTCVQLREKALDAQSFLAEAIELRALCGEYRVPLIINDNVDIALRCHADGVHVGQGDMKVRDVRRAVGGEMIIGASARTVAQAFEAEAAGADYLGVGSVFPTSTKTDALPVSRDELQKICSAVSIPVTAIGGINRNNILRLSGSGVDGVALVSAIFGADDIERECAALRRLSERMISGEGDQRDEDSFNDRRQ